MTNAIFSDPCSKSPSGVHEVDMVSVQGDAHCKLCKKWGKLLKGPKLDARKRQKLYAGLNKIPGIDVITREDLE